MAQNIAFDVIARDKASATFSKISNSSNRTEGHLKKFGKTAALAFGGVGLGAGAGFIAFLKASTTEAREAQRAGALTNQVIKSTGGIAHVSAKQVSDLSVAISKKVGIDDEAIQSGENLLLTFKGIRNEAGKGNKIFNQATQAAVDLGAGLAAASGGQINFRSATTLVGKALQDPIKGLTSLARVGVLFSKTQKAQIKALVEGGDANAAVAMNLIADTRQFNDLVKQNKGNIGAVVKTLTRDLNPAQRKTYKLYQEGGHTLLAQKKILKELKSEFGGAAASQATSADKARVAWKNLEEQVGTALLPVIDNLANKVAKDVVPAISKFVTQMQDGTGKGGELVHVLKDTVEIGSAVANFFKSLPGPVKKYGIEILVASVALNKLNGAITATRMATLKWIDSLGPAGEKMTRLQRISYGLGAGLRQLGGAGGMLAVVDGAKRGDSALGALEVTAGAAAAGFAVGGPLGAGVGAVAGGLFSLYKATTDSDKAVRASLPDYKQFAKTLDGVAASTTRATRALVLEDLQKSGLLKQTQALNISDRDAVQAAMGNEAARRRVSAALGAATASGKNYAALNVAMHLGAETTAINESRIAQLRKNLALAGTAKEAATIQAKLDRLGRTNANPVVRIRGAKQAITQLTAISQLMTDATHAKGGNATPPMSGSLLGALSGRASGGPVRAGTPYIVGEKRPELFVPSTNGTIIPRVPTGGAMFSGDITVVAQDVNDFLRQMQQRSRHSSLDGRRR